MLPDAAWLSHTTAADLQRPATRLVGGLPVSTGADLFCELSEVLGLVDLVVAGDAMVRAGMTRPNRLVRAAAALAGANAAHARRAAGLVRDQVDSPMETRLRLLIVLAGLPEPKVNPELRDGAFRTRVDLCYPELRLVIEYDGQQHRADDLDPEWRLHFPGDGR